MAQTYNDASQPRLVKLQIGGTYYFLKDAAARAILDTYSELPTYPVASGVGDSTANAVATAAQVKEYVDAQVGAIHNFDVVIDSSGTSSGPSVTASANTMYKVYLVPDAEHAMAGSYIEWITVRSGSEGSYTYAWEQIGSTTTDLSDYVKKTTTIAGVSLESNIATATLQSALGLGNMAYANTASGTYKKLSSVTIESYTPEGSITSPTFSTVTSTFTGSYAPEGSVSGGVVTPQGTITINPLSQAATSASLTTADYTPAGTVTVNTTPTTASISYDSYTPAGTVTVTLASDSVNSITSVGSLPVFHAGSYSAPSVSPTTSAFNTDASKVSTPTEVSSGTGDYELTISSASTSNAITDVGFDAGSVSLPTYTDGTLPSFTATSVATGVQSASFAGTQVDSVIAKTVTYQEVTGATFIGTKADDLQVTAVTYDKASANGGSFTGSESSVTGITFDGTTATIQVSGSYDKFAGATFNGTTATSIAATFTLADDTVTVSPN